eukprot:2756401-Rhodomonas_salina.1
MCIRDRFPRIFTPVAGKSHAPLHSREESHPFVHRSKDGKPSAEKEVKGYSRFGWARSGAYMQAPVGYDRFGYAICSKTGQKSHLRILSDYAEPLKEGDVVGCYIYLPPLPPGKEGEEDGEEGEEKEEEEKEEKGKAEGDERVHQGGGEAGVEGERESKEEKQQPAGGEAKTEGAEG